MQHDRRTHKRQSHFVHFQCTIDNHKFDTRSLNISSGGAFLETDEEIRLGALVVLIPKGELRKRLPVVLVGLVVRHQESPQKGVGIQWQKAATKEGIDRLYDFLALYLELYPATLPLPSPEAYHSPEVEYDFPRAEFTCRRVSPPGN